ncbi:hypothetical protein HHI36_003228 [Cryptolaemus montrouzieri]|uniref:28S ribosomal protein S11, mitochondrial n=1 Tax=Cryptolaemus montrouzieri TaxID=559131 RepID=A0ABD2PCZ1_9CUCU
MMIKQLFTTFRNGSSISEAVCCNLQVRFLHKSAPSMRDVVDRKEMLRSLPKPDEGTTGEKAEEMDLLMKDKLLLFPTKDTPNQLFNGIRFKDLPIFNIRSSPNNTIITLTNSKGIPELIRSCGVEGFKNARKGTNIAAQATAITIGTKAFNKGIKTVRVRVKGIGPGRMSSIKGLQMSGLQIVSITDNTPVSWNPPRPRKQRRL